MRKRYIGFTEAVLLLVVLLILTGAQAMAAVRLNVNLWPQKVSEFRFSSPELRDTFTWDTRNFVSITPIDEKKYLMADYKEIWLFNFEDKSLSPMKMTVPEAATMRGQSGFKYMPTGLFFSKKKKALYVANYKGNNILIFKVDVEGRKLTLSGEIKSPNTLGPENVFITNDGRFLSIANYDGGNVTAFDISGKKPVEIWNAKIQSPHGVCVNDDKVYATGLFDRAVFELDMKTGRIIRKLGKIGWSPENNGFLWPTSIYPYSEGELMVSDAHTGYIYIIDARTLSIKSYFGGNGPGYSYLHLPYSAIVDRDRLVILSTFQRRVLLGKKSSLEITESVGMDKGNWKHLKKRKDVQQLGIGWSDYIWTNGPVLKLWNVDYVPGYGHIYPKDNTKGYPVFKVNRATSLFNFNSYFYFLDALKTPRGGYLLFSTESPRANYIVLERGVANFVPVNFILEDHWRIGNRIYNPRGPVDVKETVENARRGLAQLKEKRLKNGLLKPSDLNEILFNITEENFSNYLSETFASKAGKNFLAGYKKCLGQECSRQRVKNLSKQYFNSVRKEAYIDIDEFILVQMLTNYMPGSFFGKA